MIWTVSVTVLLAAVYFGDASTLTLKRVERQSQDEENALIESSYGCKCVRHYLCDSSNTIDVYGDLNFKPRDNSPTKIPCKGGTFPNEILCCKLNNTQGLVARPPKDVTCGFQSTGIRHEHLAPIDGEFPWVAAIYKKSDAGSDEFHCSGSLIHPKVVLTANHCVASKKSSDFIVVVNGKTNSSVVKSTSEEKTAVSEIIKHPNYNSGARYNDAALLILEKPFILEGKELVSTLCLPPSRFDLEGSRCIVAGWGKDNFGKNAQILKKATVPFVNHEQCQTLLRNTRLGQYFTLDKSFLCAGGEKGIGACSGSGGSPLMCSIPSWSSQYSQVGIVSWSMGCGVENIPGVYTNIAQVAEWINSELDNRNLKIL